MFGVNSKHETVKIASTLASRTSKQIILIGHQPEQAQMIGKGGGSADRCTIDAQATFGTIGARRAADAKTRAAKCALKIGGNRKALRAAMSRGFLRAGPAQPAAGPKQRNRFKQIGLARTIFAMKHDLLRIGGDVEVGVVAPVAEAEALDPSQRYTRIGIRT
jgi:hypothetical protein